MADIQQIDNHIWRATAPLVENIPLHVYLLRGNGYAVWIDSGKPDMYDLLRETMQQAKVSDDHMRMILNTHPHPGHIGCNGRLRKQCGCLVAAHPRYASWHRNRAAHLSDLEKRFPDILASHKDWVTEVYSQLGQPHPVDILIDEGVRFNLGGPELETFRFSGHMMAELAWFDHESHTFFFGDTLTLIEAPFLHGHITVKGYRATLKRIGELLEEKKVERVLLAHHPPFTRDEAQQLLINLEDYLDRLDTIIFNLITGHGEIHLRDLWEAVCKTLSRQLDHRSLGTVYAHVQWLIEEDRIEEVEDKVYSSIG